MEKISVLNRVHRKKKILQFGEGNFLRGFFDYMVDRSNEVGSMDHGITIVKPRCHGNLDAFHAQNNLYTILLRGIVNGKSYKESRLITCIENVVVPHLDTDEYNDLMYNEDYRFIVSNTTEAGIVFDAADSYTKDIPDTFPGKITKLLYQRYDYFDGRLDKGFIFLPMELIDNNGDELKRCIYRYIELWNLPNDFAEWVDRANIFCNTLVDRIISGFPTSDANSIWTELGYEDKLLTTGEPYGFLAIDAVDIQSVRNELNFSSNIEVVFSDDISPYKLRKVRILNGAHTSMVPAAYLYGYDLVEQCMDDAIISAYLETILQKEIMPTISLDTDELKLFADAVIDRFKNPYLKHKLLDISLNTTAKWKARVLPSLIDSHNTNGKLPRLLTFSFAAYFYFYYGLKKQGDNYYNVREGSQYTISDDEYALNLYLNNSTDIHKTLGIVISDTRLWGQDLSEIDGFSTMVNNFVDAINKHGIKAAMTMLMKGEL